MIPNGRSERQDGLKEDIGKYMHASSINDLIKIYVEGQDETISYHNPSKLIIIKCFNSSFGVWILMALLNIVCMLKKLGWALKEYRECAFHKMEGK